jgi:hypothetical protein
MGGGIFLLSGEELVAMHEQPYDSEDLLQTLLAKYPELIAGQSVGSTLSQGWLLVKREVGVPDSATGGSRWSLDHLFIDDQAAPTLLEVKRSDDTRIRREVVGQMLDYAADGIVYWPAERLRTDFEARCAKDGLDPLDELRSSLGDEVDPERFWDDVEQNLRSGRVRLVFVSDSIPQELRRVIEFLNERMSPTEVLGIEIKQYIGSGGLKTLVPRVVGQTEQARLQKVGGGQTASVDVEWDYYEQALQPERLAVVREIFARMEAAIADEGLQWQPKLKPREIVFQRPGGYNCCGISILKQAPIEFWIKLPLAPDEVRRRGRDFPDLYPDLEPHWWENPKHLSWSVPTPEAIPDLVPVLKLTARFQPSGGPMPVPE